MAGDFGTVYVCVHCEERVGTGAKFCKQCGTADGRREMDNNNTELFASKGLVYDCKGCKNMEKIKFFRSNLKEA